VISVEAISPQGVTPIMSDVRSERHGPVVVITFDRPANANSVGGALFADLLAALEEADRDERVGAIVTTGAGRTYCVGADASELGTALDRGPIQLGDIGVDGLGGRKGLSPQSRSQIQADHLGIGRWVLRVLDIGAPMVAAVNGPAAGGGFALALLHDVRIAATTARFHAAMPIIGLAPEMGMSWLLPRVLGSGRAFDVLTRTSPVEAPEALSLGLVTQLVAADGLMDAALARATALASLPPQSARAAKRLLRAAWSSSIGEQLEREWMVQRQLFAHADTTDALRRMADRHHGKS
jgi:2-(1,2-epoxy-1,2-dihydrophenyl)acetyl-CoA isomerase